jgi:ribosomal protein S18 acetylase RimI-like enzyme
MMQVLENAWFALNLEEQHSHPLNTGWMNLLHRWSQIPAVRDSWPVIRHEYSRGFVKFCEMVGGLRGPDVVPRHSDDDIKTALHTFTGDQDFETSGVKRALETALKDSASCQAEVHFLKVPHRETSLEVPVGCLVVENQAGNGSQFYVWVRPRYRGHGHGARLLQQFEQMLTQNLPKVQMPVRIDIPDPPHTTHTSRAIDKARLLSFFTRYGFRVATDQFRREDQSSGVEFVRLERAV